MTKKIRVAMLYGGRSAEHDVSILSAANAVKAMDRARYEIVPIAIDRSGVWRLTELEDGALPREDASKGIEVALLPGGRGRLVTLSADGKTSELPSVDVVFPVLHGPFGEDGSVQGYAEVADVAYVGSGVFASATAMDKEFAKKLLAATGLPVARALTLRRDEPVTFDTIAAGLGLPFFLKPARQGSSVGVGKVTDRASFARCRDEAFRHDDKLLAEEFIEAREIECAVLEDAKGVLTVSLPGEIIPAEKHGFYTYEAKYIDADGAVVRAPADVPAAVAEEARRLAEAAFRALGCEGLARVDFFLRRDGSLILNEVNTIPGFTNISMYAKALAASGVSYAEAIDVLIAHALARHARQSSR
ncbi:D-alanine--D-alanine ligase [Nordella sp. HKS 07]|uniref:D-alanine--D-alanine ligase family protein n=1 Tax=Nordella sp. HKS 07 TaxID=2712222 RepID=UPI0013E1194A|nr:D-alanine--D-alanine ligase family protein [Nordella sp. HKS 07]QIG50502.1 D-alanine--D-alanine ligase [Nordella sp. HKS 07]